MRTLHLVTIALIVAALSGCRTQEQIVATIAEKPRTFCNPVNVDYRFMVIKGGTASVKRPIR